MAAAPDVATLVTRAQELSSTPQGLDELQAALVRSADLLQANVTEALACLQTRALDPKHHALAWTHFLWAAIAASTARSGHGAIGSDHPPRVVHDPGNADDEDPAVTANAPANLEIENDENDENDEIASRDANRSSVATRERYARVGVRGEHRVGGFGAPLDECSADLDEYFSGYGTEDAVSKVATTVRVEAARTPVSSAPIIVSRTFPSFAPLARTLLRGSGGEPFGAVPPTLVRETNPETRTSDDQETSASSQVRRCPRTFADVCAAFMECCLAEDDSGTGAGALAALGPLVSALRAARPGDDHLAKQHAMVFRCCCAAKRFDVAAEDIDLRPVYETDPSKTAIDALDYVQYCEFGGTALASLGRYEDAAELFLRAVSAPTDVPAATQIAAHKKYILCSLLANGACPFASTLPKYASPAVQRHVRHASSAYASFAEAFATRSPSKLRARYLELKATFAEDGASVSRFAALAAARLASRNVGRMTKTHLSASLADIAKTAELAGGAEEAERVVFRMIADGEVCAKIDAATASVAFLDAADDPFAAEEESARFARTVSAAREIAERVRVKDEALRRSKAYVLATLDAGGGLGGGLGASGGNGPDARDGDVLNREDDDRVDDDVPGEAVTGDPEVFFSRDD
jgi:COP9 signalosome complex subunit 3